MSEHVLLVGREEGLARRYRQHRAGVTVSVMCRTEHVSRIGSTGDCARVLALPAQAGPEEWVCIARALHAIHPVTRIALFGEQDSDRAAAVGAALGVTTHSPDTVGWVQDKHAMRTRLRATGLEDTPATLIADRAMLRSFAAEHGLPLVVKPNGGVASVGVSVARSTEDLDACFARAAAEQDAFSSPGVLAERFFEGPQFSIEGFSEDGEHVFVAIARKYSDPVTLSELGHVLPAPLSPADSALIQRYARDVLDALGVRFGPTHTEFVLTQQGPRIIETHLRLSSDTGPLVPGATGVDLIEMQIRQTMGEKVMPEIRRMLQESASTARYGAVWYANTDLCGQLVKLVGIEESGSDSEVTVTPHVQPGARLDGLRSNYSRLAEARAFAPEPGQALTMARDAIRKLRVVVHAGPAEPDCF
ncbi:MAG TPA: ATP-grasp domain-containing protein [Streptosporangiaceae bacterium]